jgi:hypothetical protein
MTRAKMQLRVISPITQAYLQKQNASGPLTVSKVSLLAGPAYFEDSKAGIKLILPPQ